MGGGIVDQCFGDVSGACLLGRYSLIGPQLQPLQLL
jgi:hypothetical protein